MSCRLATLLGMLLAVIVFAACGGSAHAAEDVDMGGEGLTGVDGNDQDGTDSVNVGPDLTVTFPAQQPTGVWALLAHCESTSNPRAVSPGGTYRGLFQFDQPTWVSVDGLSYAPRADLASPAAQLLAAQKLQARRGWAPWPYCSRHLGLR